MTTADNPFLQAAKQTSFPTPVFSDQEASEQTPTNGAEQVQEAVEEPAAEPAAPAPVVTEEATPAVEVPPVEKSKPRRKRRTSTPPAESAAPAPASADPVPPSLADMLAQTIAGQHPLDIAEALDEVFGRTTAVVRPIDMLKLCKTVKTVSEKWYESIRKNIIAVSPGNGPFYGYHFVEVAPSRKVDYDTLEKEFPEAYAATVSRGEGVIKRFVLDDTDSDA